MLAQLCALRTHDVRVLFSLETLSSAALFQETMVCSLGNVEKKKKVVVSPTCCARISAGRSTLASGTTHKRSDFTQRTEHGCITFPWNRLLLCCRSVCFPSFLLYFLIVSVMKGSMLIQDEEIICWPPGDYKATLLLMSWSPDF